MAHTPGPWRLSEDGYIETEFGEVARVFGLLNPDDETLPNARLISAAPDLLEALRGLVQVFIEGRNYDPYNPYLRPEVRAAQAAIDKAEGRSG